MDIENRLTRVHYYIWLSLLGKGALGRDETWKRGNMDSGWFWLWTGKDDKGINDTVIAINIY